MRADIDPGTRVLSAFLAPAEALKARIEETIAEHGLSYPWWIPILSGVGQLGAVIAALSLRDALLPPNLLAVAVLFLVVVPAAMMIVGKKHLPHWAETLAALVAAWLLLANHVTGDRTFDVAPALLAVVTAEVVARDGVRNGLIVACVSEAMLVATEIGPGLAGLPVHIVDIWLGFVIGYTLRWQMRALEAERAAREGEYARATLAERERIAREIHDLVAHSLSVTLLQITGARHALRDLDANVPGDIADVDDALADAERVGRQAMADIRQTVSTLADGPEPTEALPGGADIGSLVAQMKGAGLSVQYAEAGDPHRLAQATGLGLYRIAQESLANIAKHAPTSTARVQFEVTNQQAHLVVRNALPVGVVTDGRGSGLAGMSARAEQLGATLAAEAVDGDWLVDVRVPLRERNGLLSCPLKVRKLAW
ncbi:sensor histidine kinase [Nocardioides marmorisolisilvae]|uniref:histidine kinase n=1 Tax=Nocardioides marmorisolisilvae TaxID=1542737 RepID=A0A3N0DID5_9ACTN|nr:histidine kinase [Nocardioides marmorisolisilvae]RNL75447.1 histidine kinase [Nocardioides marmorisolisilvae]